MDDLLEALNEYHRIHGRYPDVLISPHFYKAHADAIIELTANMNVNINHKIYRWKLTAKTHS